MHTKPRKDSTMIDKGSVKKILLTLLFVGLANLAVAALPYNLSKDRDYIRHELDGFTYMLHSTLRAEGRDATLLTIKTINKYLGSDFKVLASYGHVRNIPQKNGSIDVSNNFQATWEIDSKSKKIRGETLINQQNF